MATFVHQKERAFRTWTDKSDLPLLCRSLFHMKTYPSATDCRAWTNNVLDRKKYIIELFNADGCQPIFSGKFVPIATVLKVLIELKNDQINNLKKRIRSCETKRKSNEVQTQSEINYETSNLKANLRNLEKENEILKQSLQKAKLESSNKQNHGPVQSSNEQLFKPEIVSQFSTKSPNFDERNEKENLLAKLEAITSEKTHYQAMVQDLQRKIALNQESNLQIQGTLQSSKEQLLKSEIVSQFSTNSPNFDEQKEKEILVAKLEAITSENNDYQTMIQDLQRKLALNNESIIQNQGLVRRSKEHLFKPQIVSQLSINSPSFDQQNEKENLAAKLESITAEKNRYQAMVEDLQTKIAQNQESNLQNLKNSETESLRNKLKDFEVLKVDRDRLKLRLDEIDLKDRDLKRTQEKHKNIEVQQNSKLENYKANLEKLNKECECLRCEVESFKCLKLDKESLEIKCTCLENSDENQKGEIALLVEKQKSLENELQDIANVYEQTLVKKDETIKNLKFQHENLENELILLKDEKGQRNKEKIGILKKQVNRRIQTDQQNQINQQIQTNQKEQVDQKNQIDQQYQIDQPNQIDQWNQTVQKDENYELKGALNRALDKIESLTNQLQAKDKFLENFKAQLLVINNDNEKLKKICKQLTLAKPDSNLPTNAEIFRYKAMWSRYKEMQQKTKILQKQLEQCLEQGIKVKFLGQRTVQIDNAKDSGKLCKCCCEF